MGNSTQDAINRGEQAYLIVTAELRDRLLAFPWNWMQRCDGIQVGDVVIMLATRPPAKGFEDGQD